MQRSFIFLVAGLLAIGLVLFLNVAPLLEESTPGLHLTHADVRGMAIEHDQLLYTLNFDQQEAVIDMVNRSLPITNEEREGEPVPFTSIVIYRFDQPDLNLKPILYIEDGGLVFTLEGGQSQGHFRDISRGNMKELFPTMYDD